MQATVQGSTDRLVRGPTAPNRSEFFKIFLVLVRFGPKTRGPGPTGFGPWIPATVQHKCSFSVNILSKVLFSETLKLFSG